MGRSNVSDSVAALFVWLASFGKRWISTLNVMLTSTGSVVKCFVPFLKGSSSTFLALVVDVARLYVFYLVYDQCCNTPTTRLAMHVVTHLYQRWLA